MIIEDQFVIDRPLQEVWRFLSDIPAIGRCVPGVSGLEQVQENNYAGSLGLRVGPIAANFSGRLVIVETAPPERIVARIEGRDRTTASLIDGTFAASLAELDPGRTQVSHRIDVTVRGRLGQFGTAVIQEIARDVTKEFARCIGQRLATGPPQQVGARGGVGMQAAAGTTRGLAGDGGPSLLVIAVRALLKRLGRAIRRIVAGSRQAAS